MSILLVDLKSNYLPAEDFQFVDTYLVDQGDLRRNYFWEQPAAAGDDFVSGKRIAEFPDLNNGSYLMVTRMLDNHGRAVDQRRTIVDLRSNLAVTVLMSHG